jgi:hypothetical protein
MGAVMGDSWFRQKKGYLTSRYPDRFTELLYFRKTDHTITATMIETPSIYSPFLK